MNNRKQKLFVKIMAWVLSLLMVGSVAGLLVSLLLQMPH